jgi:hypothetical protein
MVVGKIGVKQLQYDLVSAPRSHKTTSRNVGSAVVRAGSLAGPRTEGNKIFEEAKGRTLPLEAEEQDLEQENMLQLQTESGIVAATHKGEVHKEEKGHAHFGPNHAD